MNVLQPGLDLTVSAAYAQHQHVAESISLWLVCYIAGYMRKPGQTNFIGECMAISTRQIGKIRCMLTYLPHRNLPRFPHGH